MFLYGNTVNRLPWVYIAKMMLDGLGILLVVHDNTSVSYNQPDTKISHSGSLILQIPLIILTTNPVCLLDAQWAFHFTTTKGLP